jgi:hypothetical protein
VLILVPITTVCAVLSISILSFYRIDKVGHQRNLDRLRDAAALAEASGVEAVEGVTPVTRAV